MFHPSESLRRLPGLLPAFLLLPALVGQTAPCHQLTTRVSLNRTAGVHLLGDALWGVGDGYRVRFDEAGFEFTPALGDTAVRACPLTFRLESIGRGPDARTMNPASSRTPTFSDLRVEYDRGLAIERYDVGIDGMEQSFVFHQRPPGKGDLVVRGRLATDMVVTAHGDGLRLEQPGLGGFHIGGVVAFDSKGQRARGHVRLVDGVLELSLAAAFVDAAVLPLTLDPFFGNVFRLSSTALEFRPRVSFDLSTDSYLVVWQASNSVHAHRVSRAGALIGSRLLIEAVGRHPEVANVNDRDAFVIVYERNGDILGRIVSASGVVPGETTIAGTADTEETPTVGGSRTDAFLGPGLALCTWLRRGSGTRAIEAASLTIDPTRRPTMVVGARQTVESSGSFHPPVAPRVSKSDGSVGRYAVTYQSETSNFINVAVLDWTGRRITPTQIVGPQSGRVGRLPDVDGDGTNWVVAWNQSDPDFTAVVYARGVMWSASQQLVSPTGPERRTIQNLGLGASVSWIGESHLLGSVSNTRVAVQSFEPAQCFACEEISAMSGVGTAGSTPFGCGTIAGGGPPHEALIAGSDVNGVFAQLFRTADGVVTSLGGGCGAGGTACAPCARSPNPAFAHRLRNSIPNAPAFFVISGHEGQVACGACSFIPDLATAIFVTTSTNSVGASTVPFAIPANSSLRGVPLFEQWATLNLATPACGRFLVDFSSALRVVIQ